jgi:hypothetical protein
MKATGPAAPPWRQILKAMLWSIITVTVMVLFLRNRGLPVEVVVILPLTAGVAVHIGFWIAYNRRRPRAMFAVGAYRINDLVPSTGLHEFSEAEYQCFGRQFKHEQNFNAPSTEFLGYSWKLQLGTVSGRIYKIAPYLLVPTKREGSIAAMVALQYCTEQLGKPSSRETGFFVWKTIDGNVILKTSETSEGFSVGLFLTSSAAQHFEHI